MGMFDDLRIEMNFNPSASRDVATPEASTDAAKAKQEQLGREVTRLVKQGHDADAVYRACSTVQREYEAIEEQLDGAAKLSEKRGTLTRLTIAYRAISGEVIGFADGVEYPDGSVMVKHTSDLIAALQGIHKSVDALYERALSFGYIVGHSEVNYEAAK